MTKSRLISPLYLLITAILLGLSGCGLFEPEEEPDVTVSISKSTDTTAGVVKVTNNTDQTIYVPYIHYSPCKFLIFELEYIRETGALDSLKYLVFLPFTEEGWYWKGEYTGYAWACLEELSHEPIEPSQSFEQEIPRLRLKTGEYRVTIRYGYAEEALFRSQPWREHFSSPENAAEWTTLNKKFNLD